MTLPEYASPGAAGEIVVRPARQTWGQGIFVLLVAAFLGWLAVPTVPLNPPVGVGLVALTGLLAFVGVRLVLSRLVLTAEGADVRNIWRSYRVAREDVRAVIDDVPWRGLGAGLLLLIELQDGSRVPVWAVQHEPLRHRGRAQRAERYAALVALVRRHLLDDGDRGAPG